MAEYNTVEELKAPLLAAVGAADLALATVNEILTNLRDRAEGAGDRMDDRRAALTRLQEKLPKRTGELREKLSTEELRKAAEEFLDDATDTYNSLVERGEAALDRLMGQQDFKEAADRVESYVDQAVELTQDALGNVSAQTRAVGERAAKLVGVDIPVKKAPARSTVKKVVKQAVVITTKKMYDYKLPDWVLAHVQSKGNTISQQAVVLLVQHIGNDLSRIANELEKIQVNLHGRKNITEDDIEHFVGVSKEYNVFELQKALGQKDLPGAIRILNYFEANPKAAPIQQVLPLLYSYFSKLYMLHGIDARDERSAATTVGVHPFVLKEYIAAVRKYDQASIEKILLLLHHYNLKGVGIGDSGTSHASLMKELAVKMMHV